MLPIAPHCAAGPAMHCCPSCCVMPVAPILQKLWEVRSKALQGQQVTQQEGGHGSLGTSIFPPANSRLPFAHICALWVHFRSADTPCMHVAVLRLHAGTACTSTHTMHACSCLTGALHVGSSCLMQVLSHLAHTLHAHSCPTYTLIHCTPHPTALPVPCLRIPLLRDTLHEAEQINIYVCVCIYNGSTIYSTECGLILWQVPLWDCQLLVDYLWVFQMAEQFGQGWGSLGGPRWCWGWG